MQTKSQQTFLLSGSYPTDHKLFMQIDKYRNNFVLFWITVLVTETSGYEQGDLL